MGKQKKDRIKWANKTYNNIVNRDGYFLYGVEKQMFWDILFDHSITIEEAREKAGLFVLRKM